MFIHQGFAGGILLTYGPKSLPVSWFHMPCIIIVYGTSNGPHHHVGNYLGPYRTALALHNF